MEIYLVRHTTPNIKKGICYGQSDLGIAHSFNREAIKVKKQIPIHTSRIYCSPLQRCKILATTFDIPITYDTRLKEIDFGDWELKPWNDIPSSQLDPWMKDFVYTQIPNGESYIQLQQRVLEFYNSLNHTSEECIVIISHAGTMRALLCYIREIELKDSFDIKIKYGDVIKI